MANNDSPFALEVLSRLGSLDDPVRRRPHVYVRDSDQPGGRDLAAEATGISRTLAAYHLDKLVEAGLLRARYAHPVGRSGPGAGRPAKLYRLVEEDVALSVPPRDYELLARLPISSLDRDPTGAVQQAVNQAAYDAGQQAGAGQSRTLIAVLNSSGYQPRTTDDGCIELCNCPFHTLVDDHKDVVCDPNLNLIQGMLDGGNQQVARAELKF
ncbi:transcriptional regulator [Arthrobacter sp. E3]|uniref:helix-turn-helix transcriptional regulator n=1 Tax=Arthrobacter sp. E3 TaxID=517402 RepID=UPI001A93AA41|nr:transcriptional regulator [Arthrobacter sp. E3]